MYKIAVVDDDELYGLAIKLFFRQEFEVSLFTRVSSFLREPCLYDLVIIDYSIPAANYETSMDGCQLISHLKSNLSNPPLLVLFTGFLSQDNIEIGLEICPEADDFIPKDVGIEIIGQKVRHLLSAKTPVTASLRHD